ncbi:MAG TPA: YjjG family noncanonical pyrimidine nucleotidase [Chitinophagaceae bacterium]|nr:YjjG family noncanonical pyrimidine nucleotidase [Chitinophagaceae bacterium]
MNKKINSSSKSDFNNGMTGFIYKNIFFDLDHTIWDFETNSGLTLKVMYQEFNLSDRGVGPYEEFQIIYKEHNHRLWDRYSKGFIKQEELRWKRMWYTLLDYKIGDADLAKQISQRYLEVLPTQKELFPYTIEILKYLKSKNYELHIISNGFEKVQHEKLNNSGLTPYFKEVITSEGCNYVKPQKEIFEYAMQKTGALLKESIMIGDNEEADILGAFNTGMDSVYVNHINNEKDSKATYTIYHLKELENIL